MNLTFSVLLICLAVALTLLFRHLDLRGVQRWWTGAFFVGSIMAPIIVAGICLGLIGLVSGAVFQEVSLSDAVTAGIIAMATAMGLWLLQRWLKPHQAVAPLSPDSPSPETGGEGTSSGNLSRAA